MKPDDALKVTQEKMDACCPCRQFEVHPCWGSCRCAFTEGESPEYVKAQSECKHPYHAALRRRDAARNMVAMNSYGVLSIVAAHRGAHDPPVPRECARCALTLQHNAARKAFEEASK